MHRDQYGEYAYDVWALGIKIHFLALITIFRGVTKSKATPSSSFNHSLHFLVLHSQTVHLGGLLV